LVPFLDHKSKIPYLEIKNHVLLFKLLTVLIPHTWHLLYIAKKKGTGCWEDIKKATKHFDQVLNFKKMAHTAGSWAD
jgi:hypothetical protein